MPLTFDESLLLAYTQYPKECLLSSSQQLILFFIYPELLYIVTFKNTSNPLWFCSLWYGKEYEILCIYVKNKPLCVKYFFNWSFILILFFLLNVRLINCVKFES